MFPVTLILIWDSRVMLQKADNRTDMKYMVSEPSKIADIAGVMIASVSAKHDFRELVSIERRMSSDSPSQPHSSITVSQ